MTDPVVDFHDRMSVEHHHDMAFDWQASVREESASLDRFLIDRMDAIAHCLEDDDLAAALAGMKTRLKHGGLLLLSLGNDDALVVDRPRFTSQHVQDSPEESGYYKPIMTARNR